MHERLPRRDRRCVSDRGLQHQSLPTRDAPSLEQHFVEGSHLVGATRRRQQLRAQQRRVASQDEKTRAGDPVVGVQLPEPGSQAFARIADRSPRPRVRRRPELHRVLRAGAKQCDVVWEVTVKGSASDAGAPRDRDVGGVRGPQSGVQLERCFDDLPMRRILLLRAAPLDVPSRDFRELLWNLIID